MYVQYSQHNGTKLISSPLLVGHCRHLRYLRSLHLVLQRLDLLRERKQVDDARASNRTLPPIRQPLLPQPLLQKRLRHHAPPATAIIVVLYAALSSDQVHRTTLLQQSVPGAPSHRPRTRRDHPKHVVHEPQLTPRHERHRPLQRPLHALALHMPPAQVSQAQRQLFLFLLLFLPLRGRGRGRAREQLAERGAVDVRGREHGAGGVSAWTSEPSCSRTPWRARSCRSSTRRGPRQCPHLSSPPTAKIEASGREMPYTAWIVETSCVRVRLRPSCGLRGDR
ncbi:hypothetical protein GSI_11605 [Ganoderma sinense ZZ0214-1]|uniref:Uncharacterized protein n=1 Tax=Ganoderma sinense ZZ0214-1 TaxID=1077348 RepID=A0A2G8RWG4_9APHY|nr:hypothetical protein GSI_11605 [Ganoderma sinense ZZ0214-1]